MPARKHKLVPVLNKHGQVAAVLAIHGKKVSGSGRKKSTVRGRGYVSLGALPSAGW